MVVWLTSRKKSENIERESKNMKNTMLLSREWMLEVGVVVVGGVSLAGDLIGVGGVFVVGVGIGFVVPGGVRAADVVRRRGDNGFTVFVIGPIVCRRGEVVLGEVFRGEEVRGGEEVRVGEESLVPIVFRSGEIACGDVGGIRCGDVRCGEVR